MSDRTALGIPKYPFRLLVIFTNSRVQQFSFETLAEMMVAVTKFKPSTVRSYECLVVIEHGALS